MCIFSPSSFHGSDCTRSVRFLNRICLGHTSPQTRATRALHTIATQRKRSGTLVVAGGAFDVLHAGHIEHLERARRYGDVLVVHVVGNRRLREKKGYGRPVLDERERARIVAALRSVDYVFISDGRHYDQQVVDWLRPDVLFFNREGWTAAVRDAVAKLKRFRGRVVIDGRRKVNSSSKIIQKARRKQL